MSELEKIDLEPCKSGEHAFTVGGPSFLDGKVDRKTAQRFFCPKCGNTVKVVWLESTEAPFRGSE